MVAALLLSVAWATGLAPEATVKSLVDGLDRSPAGPALDAAAGLDSDPSPFHQPLMTVAFASSFINPDPVGPVNRTMLVTWPPGRMPYLLHVAAPPGTTLFKRDGEPGPVYPQDRVAAATSEGACRYDVGLSVAAVLVCAQAVPPSPGPIAAVAFGQPGVPGWFLIPDGNRDPANGEAFYLVRHRTASTTSFVDVGGELRAPLTLHYIANAVALTEGSNFTWNVRMWEPVDQTGSSSTGTQSLTEGLLFQPRLVVDRTPPRLDAHEDPTPGATGWVRGPVNVNVTTWDPGDPLPESASGHVHTDGLDHVGHGNVGERPATLTVCTGSACRAVAANFTLTKEGVHEWRALSVDDAGNKNTTWWTTPRNARIDLTAPQVTATWNGSRTAADGPALAPRPSVAIAVNATDATSGVDAYRALATNAGGAVVAASPWRSLTDTAPAPAPPPPPPPSDGHAHTHGPVDPAPITLPALPTGPAAELPAVDGTYTVTVEVRDRAGHVTAAPLGAVRLDQRSVPVREAQAADPGTGSTRVTSGLSVLVSANLTPNEPGIVTRFIASDAYPTPPAATSPAWRDGPAPSRANPAAVNLSPDGPTLRPIYLHFETAAGIITSGVARIVIDGEGPAASTFALFDPRTGKEGYTNRLLAGVRSAVSDDVVAWSLDGSAARAGTWQPGRELPSSLALLAQAEGPLTYHLWLRDEAGHETYAATATLRLDLTPPTPPAFTIEDYDGACGTTPPPATTAPVASDGHAHAHGPATPVQRQVAVNASCRVPVGATDQETVWLRMFRSPADASPVQFAVSQNELSTDTVWLDEMPRTFTLTGGDGDHTIRVWVRDVAGNVNPIPAVAKILLDRSAPVTEADAPSELVRSPAEVRFKTDAGAVTWWRSGAGAYRTGDVAVIRGDGRTLVEYYSVDALGNQEDVQWLEVDLDQGPPVVTSVDAAPTSVSPGTQVVVSARVQDANIAAVKGTARGLDGELAFDLTRVSGEWFRGAFTPLKNDTFFVTVVATDRLGARAMSVAAHTVTVAQDFVGDGHAHSHAAQDTTAAEALAPPEPARKAPGAVDAARPVAGFGWFAAVALAAVAILARRRA